MPSNDDQVSKRVEEALFFRLKQRAFRECEPVVKAYADCCRGRIVSIAWACRKESRVMSDCMSQYTSQLERVKQRWLAAGGSEGVKTDEDWDKLFDNLLH